MCTMKFLPTILLRRNRMEIIMNVQSTSTNLSTQNSMFNISKVRMILYTFSSRWLLTPPLSHIPRGASSLFQLKSNLLFSSLIIANNDPIQNPQKLFWFFNMDFSQIVDDSLSVSFIFQRDPMADYCQNIYKSLWKLVISHLYYSAC